MQYHCKRPILFYGYTTVYGGPLRYSIHTGRGSRPALRPTGPGNFRPLDSAAWAQAPYGPGAPRATGDSSPGETNAAPAAGGPASFFLAVWPALALFSRGDIGDRRRRPTPGLRRALRQPRALARKMELGDKAVGFLLTLTSLSIFTYYTFWVIILPFVDSDHFVHKYFLPQEYAILIPVLAGVVLLSFLSVFVGLVMFKSKKKKTA